MQYMFCFVQSHDTWWCNEITISSSPHVCRLIPFKDSTPSHIQMWVLTPRGSQHCTLHNSVSLQSQALYSLSTHIILILIVNINTFFFWYVIPISSNFSDSCLPALCLALNLMGLGLVAGGFTLFQYGITIDLKPACNRNSIRMVDMQLELGPFGKLFKVLTFKT